MKFKVDENLPIEIRDILIRSGHDALAVQDQMLSGSADSEIISICKSEGRALITLDTGFANILAYPPDDHSGIIVLRLNRQDKPYVLEAMGRLVPLLAAEPLAGKLWIVGEKRVRIWK